MNEEAIQSLKSNIHFSDFRDYLVEKINELDSLNGVEDMTDENAGQEVKARAKAAIKLTEILKPFINTRERKEPSAEEIQKAKTKFAI